MLSSFDLPDPRCTEMLHRPANSKEGVSASWKKLPLATGSALHGLGSNSNRVGMYDDI